MRIESDIRVNVDDLWVERLRGEGRLAPFNKLLSAINSSLSGKRYEAISAEKKMLKAAALGVVCAGIAAAIYFSGPIRLAAVFAAGSAVCTLAYARALGSRSAYLSEVAIMERHLVDAGFKLSWRRDTLNSQHPVVLTLEWPEE